MNKCIFYKNDGLTFRGREHIIPAGLGGKTKLPRGYVSDEANNYFSSLESVAMRETIVANMVPCTFKKTLRMLQGCCSR